LTVCGYYGVVVALKPLNRMILRIISNEMAVFFEHLGDFALLNEYHLPVTQLPQLPL